MSRKWQEAVDLGTYIVQMKHLSLQLWALLHFIMPTMFDSHDEFNEWFSKDIESHAEKQSGIDESKCKENYKGVFLKGCIDLIIVVLTYVIELLSLLVFV